MKAFRTLLIAALALLSAACGTTNTVPITGRKTRLLVGDAEILSLSTQQYQEYMSSAKVSTNQANTAMVKRVGQRLATAVETFLTNNGYAEEVLQLFNFILFKYTNFTKSQIFYITILNSQYPFNCSICLRPLLCIILDQKEDILNIIINTKFLELSERHFPLFLFYSIYRNPSLSTRYTWRKIIYLK